VKKEELFGFTIKNTFLNSSQNLLFWVKKITPNFLKIFCFLLL